MKFEKKNLFWIREADRNDVTDGLSLYHIDFTDASISVVAQSE